jgi:hypothetical protein
MKRPFYLLPGRAGAAAPVRTPSPDNPNECVPGYAGWLHIPASHHLPPSPRALVPERLRCRRPSVSTGPGPSAIPLPPAFTAPWALLPQRLRSPLSPRALVPQRFHCRWPRPPRLHQLALWHSAVLGSLRLYAGSGRSLIPLVVRMDQRGVPGSFQVRSGCLSVLCLLGGGLAGQDCWSRRAGMEAEGPQEGEV